LFSWQVAHAGAGSEAWASWQLTHFAWPGGAVACSAAWHVAHAGDGAGAWANLSPWHARHSRCPCVAAAWRISSPWQRVQIVFASRFENPCGLWQASHVTPPAWAAVSTKATLPWQFVHGTESGRGSSACGT
jgi:hypothetical protein